MHALKSVFNIGFLTLTTVCFAQFSVAAEIKKSSEIPAKREFPTNEKINPCENFYDYACSSVINSFQLREDRSSHTFAFNDSSERLLDYKKKYFEALSKSNAKSSREASLKTFYGACMDEKARATEEKNRVKANLSKMDSLKTREQVIRYFAQQIRSGDFSPVEFGAIPNHDEPLMKDLYLDISLMTLPERSYYSKKDVVEDFRQLLVMFYNSIGIKDAEKLATAVVKFETEFAQIYPLPEEFRELTSSRTGITKAELAKQFPNFALNDFLKKIPAKTHIRHFIPKAMESWNQSLATLDLETLKALYLFHTLNDELDDAYPEFFQKKFDFAKKHLGGPATRPVRDERCTKLVMGRFAKELDAILLPKMFPNFPEQRVRNLAERIRGSLVKSLNENNWLSPEAKLAAVEKIKTAYLMLVRPLNDRQWDFNPVLSYSKTLPIENLRRLNQAAGEKALAEFGKKQPKDRWQMGPLTVNAYYQPSYNQFVLPIGILQPPFFDPNESDEVNLAALGTVIGHELGHSIDDKGSKYDSKGQLKAWMNEKDLAGFAQRSAPLVTQFSKIGHNGNLTLGENIGDFVGLTSSYRAAFKDSQKIFPIEEKKKFFLQYARLWCQVERPKFSEMRLKQDPHSLGFARTNEQVKLQPGFQEAFGCKKGAPMTLDSDKRIQIW